MGSRSRITHRLHEGIRFNAAATLALTWAVVSCSGDSTSALVEPGVPLTLAEHRKETISDLRYEFAITVPSDREAPLSGSVTAEFEWDDPEQLPVVFDFRDPGQRVHGLRVNGIQAAWTPESDHLVISSEHFEQGGVNRVEIDFSAGDEALNRNEDFLYTLFVPDRAHFSLPVFDQPNLKARYSLTLGVPAHWRAVANGAVLEVVTEEPVLGGEPGAVYHFAETEPISTYLFSFVAGDFQVEEAERRGRPFRMFHRETDAEKVARNRDAIFDLHATALAWMEAYTGIAYPFEKYDFVAVPSFQYGGMEHPGAVLYRAGRLFLEESATQSAYLGRASLIAHETAHMWFGDLVTMDWFNDVWLKEVFANFMAAKIVEPSFPEVDHALRFFMAHHPTAYGVDRTEGANPILQRLNNLNEAGTLYGAIIYQKAPVTMKHLERLAGEEVFREGLRVYLNRFRFDNARWADLIEILDERTDQDLRAWSRVWVEEPGRPVVTSRITTDADGLANTLLIFQDDPGMKNRFWPQQTEALLGYVDSLVQIPVDLTGPAFSIEDRLGTEPPEWILPGVDGVGYGQFHIHAEARDRFMEQLPDLESALHRGVGYVAMWDAVLDRWVAPEDFLELLLRGMESESDEQNLQRILSLIQTTYWRLLRPETRTVWSERLEGAMWSGVEQAATLTVRATYFNTYRNIVTTDAGKERLRRIWAIEEEVPGLPLSETDYTGLAIDLTLRAVANWEGILEEQGERITNPDRRERFEFLRPALSNDPTDRERFFESLADQANRQPEAWALSGLGYLNHPLRQDHATRFVFPALEMLEEIQRTGDIFFPGRWLDAVLGGHNSSEVTSMVRDFLEEQPEYPEKLRGKILQSADMVFRSSEILYGAGLRGS